MAKKNKARSKKNKKKKVKLSSKRKESKKPLSKGSSNLKGILKRVSIRRRLSEALNIKKIDSNWRSSVWAMRFILILIAGISISLLFLIVMKVDEVADEEKETITLLEDSILNSLSSQKRFVMEKAEDPLLQNEKVVEGVVADLLPSSVGANLSFDVEYKSEDSYYTLRSNGVGDRKGRYSGDFNINTNILSEDSDVSISGKMIYINKTKDLYLSFDDVTGSISESFGLGVGDGSWAVYRGFDLPYYLSDAFGYDFNVRNRDVRKDPASFEKLNPFSNVQLVDDREINEVSSKCATAELADQVVVDEESVPYLEYCTTHAHVPSLLAFRYDKSESSGLDISVSVNSYELVESFIQLPEEYVDITGAF